MITTQNNSTTVMGEGSYGCVLSQNVLKKDNDEDDQKVSKILKIKKKDPHKSLKKYRSEYQVGKKLNSIDPEGYFFIAPNDLELIKTSNLHPEVRSTIQKECFNDTKKNHIMRNRFYHMLLDKGYDYRTIMSDIYTDEVYMKSFANLVKAVQLVSNKTNFCLLDIKIENVLCKMKDGAIFTVFIDFSSDYIQGYGGLTIGSYIRSFYAKPPGYITWTPEFRMLMSMEKNRRIADTEDDEEVNPFERVFFFDNQFMFKKKARYSISDSDMEIINPYVYHYRENPEQLFQDINDSVDIMRSLYNKKKLSKAIREKIMLWQLGKLFLFARTKDMIKMAKGTENQKMFYKLLMTLMHFNINKRLNCSSTLAYIDRVLKMNMKNKSLDKYGIKVDELPSKVKQILSK